MAEVLELQYMLGTATCSMRGVVLCDCNECYGLKLVNLKVDPKRDDSCNKYLRNCA